LLEHCVDPGAHATHALFQHAGVAPEHVTIVCQLPVASQDWTRFARQRVWPGAQAPEHMPPMHVWFMHAVPAVHMPVALQVSGVLLLQVV
jgi:hypothetical protein